MNKIAFIIIALVMFSCRGEPTMRSDLNGRWKFVAVEKPIDSKWVQDQWMLGGEGYLIYNNKGHMSIHITPKDYQNAKIIPDKNSLADGSWPLFELMDSASNTYSFSNYAFTGKYHVSGDTLVHKVVTHGNPELFGREIIRKFSIVSDTLIITPALLEPPVRVVWVRSD